MGAKRIISLRLELITVAAILSLIAILRLYHLDADPPTGLSVSTGVETDPPQYTVFARNYVQTGEFDPFHDARRSVFLKSSVTGLAVAVFGVLGTGIWQSHFVGFLYGFGALLLFWLFVRRVSGPVAGLLFLLLISVNYNLVFFGRLPFLEHALAFWGFLALVIVSHVERPLHYIWAGLALGIGIFFGKVIGLIFLFPFACWFGYRMLFGDYVRRSDRLLQPLFFAGGFAVATLLWLFFTYLPAQSQVTGYFGEQAVSLYGAPDGLKSIDDFFRQMVTFGDSSKLFPRMRSVAVIATILIGMAVFHIGRARSWREGFGGLNAGQVTLVAMIVAFYGSLMIWNYRPMRYQLVMVYPFYGAAATVLAMIWAKWKAPTPVRTPLLFYPLMALVLFVPVYQIWEALADRYGWEFYFDDNKFPAFMVALVIAVLIGLYLRYRDRLTPAELAPLSKGVVIAVLLANLGFGVMNYYFWAERPTFTARDNGRDLGIVLASGGAVISGPYAPQLAMENDLPVVIQMFGVAQVDTSLFRRFPITHLLIDESNENAARADYPQLMDSAVHVLTYHVGLNKVRLFRIAGLTGNPQADAYRESPVERMIDSYHDDMISAGNELAARLLAQYPDNMSIYLTVAEVAALNSQLDLAEESFKKAVEFSPTNYHLNSRLAQFYKDAYAGTGKEIYKEQGLEYFERAMHLAPTVQKMDAAYRELKEKSAWQLNADSTSSSQP